MPGLRHIAFRADASSSIGIGHVMRCLCLADELRERGFNTHIVTRAMPEPLRGRVRVAGHALHVLPSPPPLEPEIAWPVDVQYEDASASLDSVGEPLAALVVDHYSLRQEWEDQIASRDVRLVAIDDLAREHTCDVLLDQNLYSEGVERYAGKVPSGSRLLVGPDYALLRAEFAQARRSAVVRGSDGDHCRIFVLFGGGDALDLTSRGLQAIGMLDRDDIAVDAVIGPEHPRLEFIVAECARRGYACHVDSNRVAELMASADVALGASGSASWERCCVGLPCVSVAIANNQVGIGQSLERVGVAVHLGGPPQATGERMAAALGELVNDRGRLRVMSERAFRLVDGEGRGRVADIVESIL
jgi:UDP-2,4-diacetamido-2,4,6-trideoxy-beta-L-altropyranose hydrolase